MTPDRFISVLLVEDSPVVRQRLRAFLTELPPVNCVAEAEAANEAMRKFDALRPAVAVLDLRLPQGSGLDVLRHIKRTDPACTTIVLTNLTFPDSRAACAAAGADHFLHKATEFERVAEIVTAVAQAAKV